ncbi:isoleucyl tRNA synthetase [Culex quinquefasciatus]|uniref:Isoleucyl tRNA synthetase n=1 Tax=Culex quinquefasciatus TaxID=7176 RepID=B0WER4_CULQU|nr:isoleucyl tRNA synthetase [Culex quinquefasciatus]|eukprot:XP_001847198.1 isoleucyl tRNA synthetase [Culex quinquefasciatus]
MEVLHKYGEDALSSTSSIRRLSVRRICGAPSRGREAPAPIASPAAAKAKAPKESTKGKVLFVGKLKRTITI